MKQPLGNNQIAASRFVRDLPVIKTVFHAQRCRFALADRMGLAIGCRHARPLLCYKNNFGSSWPEVIFTISSLKLLYIKHDIDDLMQQKSYVNCTGSKKGNLSCNENVPSLRYPPLDNTWPVNKFPLMKINDFIFLFDFMLNKICT